MKNIIFIFCFLILVSKVSAQTPQPTVSEVSLTPTPTISQSATKSKSDLDEPHLFFGGFGGLGFGLNYVINDLNHNPIPFGTGLGCGIYGGRAFDRNFSLALQAAEYNFPFSNGSATSSVSLQELELMTVIKYTIGDSGFRPYGVAGMGANWSFQMNSNSVYSAGSTSPMFEFGLGLSLPLGREFEAFVEGDWKMVIQYYNGQGNLISYFPVNAGLQWNLF